MSLHPGFSRSTYTLLALALMASGFVHGSGKAKPKKRGAKPPVAPANPPLPPPPGPGARPTATPASRPPAKMGLSAEDAQRLKLLLAQREVQRKKDLEAALGLAPPPSKSTRDSRKAEAKSVLEPGYLPNGVHPFFDLSTANAVGSIKIFNLGAGARSTRCLVSSSEGLLLWLGGEPGKINAMTPNGMQFEISPEGSSVCLHLLRDSMGRIRYFGDRSYGTLHFPDPPPDSDPRGLGLFWKHFNYGKYMDPGAVPVCVAAGEAGQIAGFTETKRFIIKADGSSNHVEIEPGEAPSAAIWDGKLKAVAAIRPDKDEYVLFGEHLVMDGPLPGEGRPHGLAVDGLGRIWITLPNKNQVKVLDSASGANWHFPAEPGEGEFLAPRGIALGPDGNMWVTVASGIIRIKPDGAMTPPYRLPQGMTALDIWPSDDGRMFFSLTDKAGIGAITALPQSRMSRSVSAPLAHEESKAPRTSVYVPRPPRPRLSRSDRHKRLDEWQRKADEIFEARMAQERLDGLADQSLLGEQGQGRMTEPEEGKEAPPRGMETPKGESKAPVVVEPGPSPSERLNDLRVYLRPRALEHIHATHGPWKNMEKSQFAECHGSPEAIERLIAQGMEDSGAIGSVVDAYGRQYTLCRSEETLWYRERGFSRGGRSFPARYHATHLFVVVTIAYDNGVEDDADHVVLTAFPVSRNW